jgi:hypothetical protein
MPQGRWLTSIAIRSPATRWLAGSSPGRYASTKEAPSAAKAILYFGSAGLFLIHSG